MSTYYSLKVSRARSVAWESRFGSLDSQVPSLYVEIGLGETIQKTNTIKDSIEPAWDETLPLICKDASTRVSVKLKHRSKLKDKTIGRVEVELTKLLNDCMAGETELHLSVDGRPTSTSTATIIVHLIASDLKVVAELALYNLVRDMPKKTIVVHLIAPYSKAVAELALQNLQRDIPNNPPSGSTLVEEIGDKADRFGKEGKIAITDNSDLFKALRDTIPAIEGLVKTIDSISDAHPYLKLGWYIASALYRIISAQVKADERFKNLVKTLAKLFEFVKDAERLRDILHSLRSTISELLGVISECCLLMRKHARHSFAGRSLNVGDRAKLDELETSLKELKGNLAEGFSRQTAVIAEYTSEKVKAMALFGSLDRSPNEEINAYDRPKCLDGTRTKILKQIIDWAKSNTSPNIFWLNGVAGSGKSTIAMSIAEHFHKESQLGAHLFFTRDKSTPGRVIPDLAYALASTIPFFASHLPSTIVTSASADGPFKELIQDPLTKCDNEVYDPIIIILDAIDECGTSLSRQKLMLLLQNEISKLPPKFRFFITSRPESDISNALSRVDATVFELDSSSADSKIDVRAYLQDALPRAITVPVPEGWSWDDSVVVLSNIALGLFIWASTLVKLVSESTFPFRYLKNLARNSTSLNLQDLYDAALKRAFPIWDEPTTKIFSNVIALILFSSISLSDNTIDGILGLSPHEGSSNILSKLLSLIAYERGKPIRLHHTSFNDYMTSPFRKFDAEHPWFFDINDQKQLIAGRCFEVMESSPRFNICDIEIAFIRNKDVSNINELMEKNIPSHLIYACRFWAQHLRNVPSTNDLLNQLTTFTYEHLFNWREVLSLSEDLYQHCSQALQDAIEWIKENNIGEKKPELSRLLSALSHRNRFHLSHQLKDLDDSIRNFRATLDIIPEGHPNRHITLSYLASSLSDRFNLCHQCEDLDESIRLHRTALTLCPEGHPDRHYSLYNLASSLRSRLRQSHQREDLDECTGLERAVPSLRSKALTYPSGLLNKLATFLRFRFEHTHELYDLEESIELRKSATLHPLSSSLDRMEAAVGWSTDARKYNHTSTLEAYEMALSLSQRALTLILPFQRQHDFLIGGKSYPTLPLDAASYAIEKGNLKKAVEMLEQVRGLLWSRMRGFGTPIDSLAKVYPSFADRLKDITTQLDALSTTPDMRQDASSNAFAYSNTFDEMLRRKRQLSEEQERIVEEIRMKPGFSDFLKFTSFATLQSAADEGPVIIINHCKYRSDCIIVLKEAEPVCIPLAETFYEEAQDQATHLFKARKERLRSYPRLYDHVLQSILGWLWRSVVSLVVDKLTEIGIPKQSRIWWCPTSVLTSLPLHAAGPNGFFPLRYLVDDFICSYTATLQALNDIRKYAGAVTALSLEEEQTILLDAELAFLPACRSCVYDEVFHLAAGMKFCGYRNVVGTMWEMNVEDGPFVVKHFYKRMFPKNAQRTGYKESARALQKSILLFRAQEVSVERWVNFIHIGA